MSEAAWTAKIRETAAYYGWLSYHTHNSKFSEPGWPDFVLGHPRRRRTIFAELKTETGRLSDPQRAWLAHLTACGFETALWRPSDMDTVIAVLGPQQLATRWEGP
jgi:VRR-NUC domain-containing protein